MNVNKYSSIQHVPRYVHDFIFTYLRYFNTIKNVEKESGYELCVECWNVECKVANLRGYF